jgi:hypothetical protein
MSLVSKYLNSLTLLADIFEIELDASKTIKRTGLNVIKLFMPATSWSVCPWQAF